MQEIIKKTEIKNESKCRKRYSFFIYLVHRLDVTLSGSSNISSKSLADLFLTLVDFDLVEDFVAESLKISSKYKK